MTFVFIFLWYLDFSTLTLIALITIFVTVLDYGYPMVSKFIFKPENWSGSQEKIYELVIEDVSWHSFTAKDLLFNYVPFRSLMYDSTSVEPSAHSSAAEANDPLS